MNSNVGCQWWPYSFPHDPSTGSYDSASLFSDRACQGTFSRRHENTTPHHHSPRHHSPGPPWPSPDHHYRHGQGQVRRTPSRRTGLPARHLRWRHHRFRWPLPDRNRRRGRPGPQGRVHGLRAIRPSPPTPQRSHRTGRGSEAIFLRSEGRHDHRGGFRSQRPQTGGHSERHRHDDHRRRQRGCLRGAAKPAGHLHRGGIGTLVRAWWVWTGNPDLHRWQPGPAPIYLHAPQHRRTWPLQSLHVQGHRFQHGRLLCGVRAGLVFGLAVGDQ